METTFDKNHLVDKLNAVLAHLKTTFVGEDDIIDLMGICLAGRENLFLLGLPPRLPERQHEPAHRNQPVTGVTAAVYRPSAHAP
ncbi:hypothetical protein KK062_22135 [Fulvivirgaceae bacterium PWU5]|uniref:MoxR domain-containing protein n=1 Tax=Dawidia cretensis TaxID=2782350 RepID=A0AAP2E2R4_9BACT|nr:hypothetical protein [Dawidia cretensis]MBT1710958.1 hypothetical protein [Dawidia cretensis]